MLLRTSSTSGIRAIFPVLQMAPRVEELKDVKSVRAAGSGFAISPTRLSLILPRADIYLLILRGISMTAQCSNAQFCEAYAVNLNAPLPDTLQRSDYYFK
jgi:hypothetical protein